MIVPMPSRDAFVATMPAVSEPQRLTKDAHLLLRSGRAAMALTLMERRLAARIVAATTHAADVSRCHLHRSRTRS
jgi:hypothetical protein